MTTLITGVATCAGGIVLVLRHLHVWRQKTDASEDAVEKKYLLYLSSAVECIHAYSLIHDDLPCMDDDDIRRGKLTTHKKFGESTAVLAGNSLLTLAFEILSDPKFNINNNKKISLINLISQSSGHQGIAGGQFLDLNYEKHRYFS